MRGVDGEHGHRVLEGRVPLEGEDQRVGQVAGQQPDQRLLGAQESHHEDRPDPRGDRYDMLPVCKQQDPGTQRKPQVRKAIFPGKPFQCVPVPFDCTTCCAHRFSDVESDSEPEPGREAQGTLHSF
jgi:hypothetical protein